MALFLGVLCLAALSPGGLMADPESDGQTSRRQVATAWAGPPTLPGTAPFGETEACEDGLVLDDGTVETGWGWVPSAVEGVYLQRFEAADVPSLVIDEVCVCWLRTLNDDSIDFEVVFYRDEDGRPAELPFAAIPGSLEDVPQGIVGTFVNVPTPGVRIPPGAVYIGVRWDPSASPFFFTCADTSEETEPVIMWFRDDRAEDWDNTEETIDPLFDDHRAILVRPVPSNREAVDVPAASASGLALLTVLLFGAGFAILRR